MDEINIDNVKNIIINFGYLNEDKMKFINNLEKKELLELFNIIKKKFDLLCDLIDKTGYDMSELYDLN